MSVFWIVSPGLAHPGVSKAPNKPTAREPLRTILNELLQSRIIVKRIPSWVAVLPSLVVPVCLGLSMYLGLQYLIDTKTIADETTLRYLTGHPVSKITVAMFLIGMASLLVIGWNLVQQFSSEKDITLGDADVELQTESETDTREKAVDHGQAMLDLPNRLHSHYLWERLVNAVHSIYRTGSTSNVEEELKYLSDIDLERQQQRYALVRILIWATPMLGFLGTVLGISQALGGIAVGPDNDFQQMMDGLRGNLYIAFDTTALALTLSMAMMFGQFLIERFESQLLRLVDQRARSEISRHYELTAFGTSTESNQIVDAIRNVVSNQTEIWRDSIRMAEQAWTASLTQSSDLVRDNLTQSLDENVAALAHYLGESIEKADQSISQRWSQWQVSLSENARLMERHMLTLSKQTESVQQIVGSLEDSTAFEAALKHQQDAVMATVRTHRVLNELLRKVDEAGMVPEPAAPVVESAVAENLVQDLTENVNIELAGQEVGEDELAQEQLQLVDVDDDVTDFELEETEATVEEVASQIRIYDEGANEAEDEAVAEDEIAAEDEVVAEDEVMTEDAVASEESSKTQQLIAGASDLSLNEIAIQLKDAASDPEPVVPVNQSNSARIARALAGDAPDDTSDHVVKFSQNDSHGKRRAA